MMLSKACRLAVPLFCVLSLASTGLAQFTGIEHGELRNISLLKPPTGSKVAIVVFEDLGCPACAHAHPFEINAAKAANVSVLRYDFPIEGHVWTFDGAVCARYIQKKISPALAEQFRGDVFRAQQSISNKDDIRQFTQHWLQQHGQQMPFVLDPTGELAREVRSDYELGLRVNVRYTPTVVVVTKDRQQIVCGTKDGSYKDAEQIRPVVDSALSKMRLRQ